MLPAMRSTPLAARFAAAPAWLVAGAALVAGAGCYAPRIEPGSACTTVCPGGLVCIAGTCVAEDDGDGPDLTRSLVAHWRFDDDPEDGVFDSSGRGHHATCQECPELVIGRMGGGYEFDAIFEEIIVVPDHPDFRGPYTIAAWIYAESAGEGEQMAILSKPFGSGTGNSWQLELLGDGAVSLSGGDPHSLSSGGPLPAREWHHVAGRFDGVEKELFIDGKEVKEVDATVEYDGHAIYLGGDQNGGAEVLHWDGVIDDVRIYSRALEDAEIEALAQ